MPRPLLASFLSRFSVVLATVLVGGCDDGPATAAESPPGSTAEVATFEAFTRVAAARYCARRVVPCCSGPAATEQAACEADLQREIADEIGGEGGTYSAEGGAKCLAAIDALGCGSEEDALERPCRDIMRGADFHRKQGGETCALESDCAAPVEGSATCDHGCDPGDASCSVGYCVAYVEVPAGAACENDGTKAPLVHRCERDGECVGGVCRAFPKSGEPCPTGVCQDGLRCSAGGVCEVAPGSDCR